MAAIHGGNQMALNEDQKEMKEKEEQVREKDHSTTTDSNYKKIDVLAYNLKKAIDNYSVISFDIFDTLLVRPYVRPIDLFIHMEKLYNVTGFTEARMMAEREIRRKSAATKDDITFDEIYEQIDSKYKWLKEKELAMEYDSLNARPFMKEIYNYACKKNKRMIIISDMYLSKQFLSEVLKKNGYTTFEQIYISSEYGKTKGTGDLYKIALEDLNLSVKDIMNIGDNKYSDVIRPRKLGVNAFHVPKVFEFLSETDSKIEYFYKDRKEDIGTSIMLGLLAYQSESSYKNYWYEFGYKYAGPLIFGYMQWLEDQLKTREIDQVLFIARDGYTLEKVFKLIGSSEVHTDYLYLPRNIAREILNEDSEIAEKSKNEYRQYLKQFDLQGKKIAVIDSVTYWWSSQKALVHLLPEKEIIGYYWLVGPTEVEGLTFETFQKNHIHKLGEMIELFMTAPTPPVETITKGKPVFKKVDDAEEVRIKIYPDISKGAIDFAKDYINSFKKIKGFFSCEMLMDWIKLFQSRPTEIDKISFFNIEHASDENHESYHKLMSYWY
ncbi:hypothetical protein PIROE2DRAFT_57587 [Piromyces sp. E2]|nr:hypothetical protein PIROE2DRAFT_57587 [Piromyces sp. E2]|eukprot:OUM69222.1 hypothetical protein PIROE2DRAFT_57587 [Piromyces sp. E2]